MRMTSWYDIVCKYSYIVNYFASKRGTIAALDKSDVSKEAFVGIDESRKTGTHIA